MISNLHITDRMIRTAENRTGCDFRRGLASLRNLNRAAADSGGKAIATRREGQVYADASGEKPDHHPKSSE